MYKDIYEDMIHLYFGFYEMEKDRSHFLIL
jgi:hypothetical protein